MLRPSGGEKCRLAIARADGSLPQRLLRLSRLDMLIVDDWAMSPKPGETR